MSWLSECQNSDRIIEEWATQCIIFLKNSWFWNISIHPTIAYLQPPHFFNIFFQYFTLIDVKLVLHTPHPTLAKDHDYKINLHISPLSSCLCSLIIGSKKSKPSLQVADKRDMSSAKVN